MIRTIAIRRTTRIRPIKLPIAIPEKSKSNIIIELEQES